MKFFIIAGLILSLTMAYAVDSDSIAEIEGFSLIGIITHDHAPLQKSVVVIRDETNKKTFSLPANKPLPGTDWRLQQIERHFLVYDNGRNRARLVKSVSLQKASNLSADISPDSGQISEEKIRAETELIWERLRNKSQGQGLRVEAGQDTITAESYICDEDGCRDDEF